MGLSLPRSEGESGQAPACRESCDANSDGGFDISDMVFLLGYLFAGGNPPAGWIDSNADGRKDPTCETAQAGDDGQTSHGPCR